MPSNEKRRDVAAKLYEMIVSTTPTWPALMEVMGKRTRSGALMEIVHLIEPEERTCRSIGACGQGLLFSGQYDEEIDNYIPFGAYIHQLSCGHYVVTEELEPPCYCAYCGAKVIHDA